MDIHKNARLTPHSRAELVRRVLVEGQSPKAGATAFGVGVKTVHKWVARFLAEGPDGLVDRSSRPHRLRAPTPDAVIERIEALRRQRWTGQQIALDAGVSRATVSRVLWRLGLNKLRALELAEPVIPRCDEPDSSHLGSARLRAAAPAAKAKSAERAPATEAALLIGFDQWRLV